MYSLWQRSLSTLAFCDCISNKNAVNFVKDLREIAAIFLGTSLKLQSSVNVCQ